MVNEAKTFLRRYKAVEKRIKALERAIREAEERATDISVHIKEVSVLSSGTQQLMADSVVKALDATAQLREEKLNADRILAEVLEAINSVPDEMQKTILLMRYVTGMSWIEIQETIGYEISNTYILHGRALQAVNKWLKGKKL